MSRGRRRRLAASVVALAVSPALCDATVAPSPAPQPAVPQATIAPQTLAFGATVPAPSPAPGATPSPELPAADGDLAHLTYTATAPLVARLVSPTPGSGAPAAGPIEVETGAGGGVELAVNGAVIPTDRIGKREVAKRDGTTRYVFFGVALRPGPNDVVLVPLGAGGLRGAPVRATIYGPGAAASVQGSVPPGLVADGTSSGTLRAHLFDARGTPAGAGEVVRATVVSGDVALGGIVRAAGAAGVAGSANAPASSPNPVQPDPFPNDAGANDVGVLRRPQAATIAAGDPSSPSPASPGGLATNARAFEGRSDASGVVEIPVRAGTLPGEVAIRLELESGAGTLVRFRIAPYLRAPFVSGLVSAGVGSLPAVPGQPTTVVDGADSQRGRIAIFGSGRAFHDALVTVAYDTADVLDESIGYGPFISDPSERPYQTYGDASVRRDDALSRSRLYARIDRGSSSLMYGEFQAVTGDESAHSLGGYDLLVNGVQAQTAIGATRAAAFHARDDVAYGRQVFAPTGLSSLGVDLHSDIVVGSDVVELASIDRASGVVISETALARDVDYVLDYGTGALRFITIPLPFDASFNPQRIVVRYEYDATAGGSETTGGRIATTLGGRRGVTLAAGYVNDAQGSGNVSLASESVTGPVPGGTFSLQHMRSTGRIGTGDLAAGTTIDAQAFGDGGDAYQADVDAAVRGYRIALQAQVTTAGYDDPFGGLSTPGLFAYRASVARRVGSGDLQLDVAAERNVGVGYQNAQRSAAATYKRAVGKRLKLVAGLAARSYSAGTSFAGSPTSFSQDVNPVATPAPALLTGASPYIDPDGGLVQASVAADYRISRAVDVAVSRLQDLAGTASALEASPTQTTAELGVSFAKEGRAYLRESWNASPVDSFAAASAVATAQTSGSRATELGFERALGPATTVDTGYLVQNTGSGTDVYTDVGIKEAFAIGPRVKGSADVEKATAVGSGVGGFNLYDLQAVYALGSALRASGSYQLRTGAAPGSTLALGAAGALTTSLSLVGTLQDASVAGYSSDDDRLSLAYRPAKNDDVATLFGYERENGTSALLGTRTSLLSLEQFARPTRSLELSARVAYKLDGDRYYQARTSLLSARADQRVGGPASRFDLAVETRYLSAGSGLGSDAGAAVEAGVTIGDANRAAIGYDLASAPDPSLAVAPRRAGIYATFTSVVDSVFGWGKSR